jgi:serine/threonine protein kinase
MMEDDLTHRGTESRDMDARVEGIEQCDARGMCRVYMMPNHHNLRSKLFYSSLLIAVFIIYPLNSQATGYNLNHNPQSYVIEKLKSHDIVLLGTRHKQPAILNFISEIITVLHDSRVTYIGLEIESDQQHKIDKFIKTGAGLSDIQIHSQIDCPAYRDLLKVLMSLDPDKRPTPIAIDLPKSKYREPISRDEWMAESIEKIFKKNQNAKILVVVGDLHILKKLDWQDHVPNAHRSIREYLSEKRSNLRIFSIGQIIGKSVYEDDFRERFGPIEGVVAIDLDEQFAEWKSGITQSLAIKPEEVWKLLDGLIVY